MYRMTQRNREWLETDGLGGYSSLTETWENRRKYHGLFVPSTGYGFGRRVLVQALLVDGVYPRPASVDRGLHPTFKLGGMDVGVLTPRGLRAVVLRFELACEPRPVRLRPFLNSRSMYDVSVEMPRFELCDGRLTIDGCPLNIASDAGTSIASAECQRMEHRFDIDSQRGEACSDSSWSPVEVIVEPRDRVFHVSFSLDEIPSPAEVFASEVARRAAEVEGAPAELRKYALGTEAFVMGEGGVIAGYHWFSQWGRDALISLPGLSLIFGRFREARQTLEMYASLQEGGLVPNAQDERTGAWSYNSSDAVFWFADRLWRYALYSQDWEAAREFLPCSVSVYRSLLDCAGEGLTLDGSGCVCHPPQWTWMDAAASGKAFTPRDCAVEIQAMAYAGAMGTAELMDRVGYGPGNVSSEEVRALAGRIRSGFEARFFDGALVLDSPGSEEIRPNVLFAVYFDHPLMEPGEFGPTLEAISPLVTPYGLRTLSPLDQGYRGAYLPEKESAYHNGTVWPFLAGAMARAWTRVHQGEGPRREAYDLFLRGILEGLHGAGRCPGHVAEILDGDYPHIERGCIAQAWSIAEPLRALWEDVLQKGPVP